MRRISICLLLPLLFSQSGADHNRESSAISGVMRDSDQVSDVVDRAGDRIQDYYEHMLNMICTETVLQQELQTDLTAKGRAREFVYDYMLVSPESATDTPNASRLAIRKPKLIDGKPVKKDYAPKCIEPKSTYIDPLAFLLPTNRTGYTFSHLEKVAFQGRNVLIVAFAPIKYEAPRVSWEGNCFKVTGKLLDKGRIWIDPDTFDVIQLEQQLVEPFEFKTPKTKWSGPFFTVGPSHKMTVEKSITTLRYQRVVFQNPAQILLVPSFSESVRVIRGAGIPILRTTQSFTNYQRFTAEVKIKDAAN